MRAALALVLAAMTVAPAVAQQSAADAAHAGEYGVMVSLRGETIGRVPLAEATAQLKLVPQWRYDDAGEFFG